MISYDHIYIYIYIYIYVIYDASEQHLSHAIADGSHC